MEMMWVAAVGIALSGVVAPAVEEEEQVRWVIGASFLGSAYNVPTPLAIYQMGYDDILLDRAEYDTKPFLGSPYYSLRVARWKGDRAWGIELLHHKLYLSNDPLPPDVQEFEISHGYNLLMADYALMYKGFLFHLGAGIVITHPETTVRNQEFDESRGLFGQGYYVSGLAMQIAAGRRFYIYKGFFAGLEAKFTAARAWIPIEGGLADVPNVAFHGLVELGYKF